MTGPEMNEVFRVIGGLQTAVSNLTRQWREQDRIANESREKLTGRIEELRDDVNELKRDMHDIKPIVAHGEATLLQGVGIGKLLRVFGYIIVAILGALGHSALNLFTHSKG